METVVPHTPASVQVITKITTITKKKIKPVTLMFKGLYYSVLASGIFPLLSLGTWTPYHMWVTRDEGADSFPIFLAVLTGFLLDLVLVIWGFIEIAPTLDRVCQRFGDFCYLTTKKIKRLWSFIKEKAEIE